MPNTESKRPSEMENSCDENGVTLPNACCSSNRVASPVGSKRGIICARTNTITGICGGANRTSSDAVFNMNDGRPSMPMLRGRNPFVKRPPLSVDATSPREFTAV